MADEKRLIDANALLEELDKFANPVPNKSGYDFLCGMATAITEIEDAPTVDAVEVVHAEWEKYTDDKFIGYGADGRIRYRKVYSYKCSKCWNYTAVKHKYCPNCGAKMDGERREGE